MDKINNYFRMFNLQFAKVRLQFWHKPPPTLFRFSGENERDKPAAAHFVSQASSCKLYEYFKISYVPIHWRINIFDAKEEVSEELVST